MKVIDIIRVLNKNPKNRDLKTNIVNIRYVGDSVEFVLKEDKDERSFFKKLIDLFKSLV